MQLTLPEPSKEIRIPLRFFRRDSAGNQRPVILYIDGQRNFIEEVDDVEYAQLLARSAEARARIEAEKLDVNNIREAVQVAIDTEAPLDSLSPDIQKKIKEGQSWLWFSKDHPNQIPGSEALRERYFAELQALHARHAANGTKCKGCEEGEITRKYRKLLKQEGLIP